MSAAASIIAPKELRLRPRPGYPRRMMIEMERITGQLQVSVYSTAKYSLHLVFAIEAVADCRLTVKSEALWIGGTSFKLHPAEIAAVREFVKPLGVTIEE